MGLGVGAEAEQQLARRRRIAALSVIGAANMGLLSLRQLGVIRHLPDPPIPGFDADAVTTSAQGFIFGFPDAPFAVATLAANLPLALIGGPDRARTRPAIPLLAAAKSVADAAAASWYFTQMGTRLHKWCAYCIMGAAINVALAAEALPEAREAAKLAPRRTAWLVGAVVGAGLAFWVAGRERPPAANARRVA